MTFKAIFVHIYSTIFLCCICCVRAGKAWPAKVGEVREKMKDKDCKGLVVTALDEIACKFI